ncbi:uncharacterized protein EV422DRAFT_518455 [Fimicolochytrium jonesii]|uniref:uncharacterized protein n=1 Tax=Fimicolochytrium jonesii TaxID=1396493 RepID=UPI0022FE9E39|nr:uncharacterized protein EV422DRAFT_518455 [Fimicolochytrium jonesii]KAI8823958.1 hypothetical protein EV422DRAFT_518455 [Fimicolochytrium jonesii]
MSRRDYPPSYSSRDEGYGNNGYGNGSQGGRYAPQDNSNYGEKPGSYRSNGGGGGYEAPNKWAAAASRQESHQGTGYKNYDDSPYRSWETVNDEPEDYDNEGWLTRKTQKVQNDSLMSTRRTVARIAEADTLAQSNMARLGSQEEQLMKVNTRMESAGQYAKVADAKTDHLKSLNRMFFMPTFGSKKAKKREEKYAAAASAYASSPAAEEEDAAPEPSRGYGRYADESYGRSNNGQRSYSTPANIERDATEEEIDSNIDQISAGLGRLKMMSQAMNESLGKQTGLINKISERTDYTRDHLRNTTRKIENIK